jgi:hypothetical protein
MRANSPPAHPTRSRRRRVIGIGSTALLAGLGALVGAGSGRASTPSPVMICSARPAADAMRFGPVLASTVRVAAGTAQVLHEITCNGGPASYQWLSAADLGQ